MYYLKDTYRLLAVLALLLFVSTIALPAGLAAASLSCDMEMAHNVPVCCATADMNSHQEKKEARDCEQQAFCTQEIDSNPSETPAVTQHSKLVIVAKLLEKRATLDEENDHPPTLQDEPSSLQFHPPIFLLNSTFLN